MPAIEGRTYRTREFATLAGVTVRALHHYDRVGLLKPRRTQAGYRVYTEHDLEALEQIVALKFIGVPLKKIAVLRGANAMALANAMLAQRATLEEKRRLLDQAIGAITEAEAALRGGKAVETELFRRIIEVIEMQDNSEEWNTKYETLVHAKVERLKALSPEAIAELKSEWTPLIEDIQQALGEDPAGPRAQELATRWVNLLERLMGGPVPAGMMGYAEAKPATSTWQSHIDQRVWDFMGQALAARSG